MKPSLNKSKISTISNDFQYSRNICIRWKQKQPNLFVAQAFQQTGTSDKNLNSIQCPQYSGITRESVIQQAVEFVESRGKNVSHGSDWNSTNLDFNNEFSQQYWDNGKLSTHYQFTQYGNMVYLELSFGGINSHLLTSREKNPVRCGSWTTSAKFNKLKLAFGRYSVDLVPCQQSILMLGNTGAQLFELCFISTVLHKSHRERLRVPGFTIANPGI